jgi:hypothetical protein
MRYTWSSNSKRVPHPWRTRKIKHSKKASGARLARVKTKCDSPGDARNGSESVADAADLEDHEENASTFGYSPICLTNKTTFR